MSCGCNQDPCVCPSEEEAPAPLPTLCDGDRVNNVWVEGADENGVGGICLLDTMEECQVIYSIERDPTARADLLRVTTNEYLINLANTVPTLSTEVEGDKLQTEGNQGTIPFYTLFRGQPPFAQ